MKDRHEQLLNGLIAGQVSPAEFRQAARQPGLVTCAIFDIVYVSPPCPSPDDPCEITVDGIKKQSTYSEYLALREKYPAACLVPPLLFVTCSGCLPDDPLCHCVALPID